jgi:hypothetical protein
MAASSSLLEHLMDDAQLREKLRKIEALFGGAKTAGERAAAGAAAERIKARLLEAETREPAIEFNLESALGAG